MRYPCTVFCLRASPPGAVYRKDTPLFESGTCTTLTATVHWTKMTSNASPSATPSSRVRVTGTKPLSRRTRRSWLTCGTKSLSWLTLIRTEKSQHKSSLRESSLHAKENLTQNYPPLSNFSLTRHLELLMLTVTVQLV